MIRLTDLTKRYGKFTAVDGISLEVPRGELFGLLGPNGAGKTTTMRMIAGILRPTSGSVDGGRRRHAGRSRSRPRRAIGFIPDRPFVYDKLTGGEFLRFAAALYGQDGPGVERRIDELLELFDLTAWKHELTESYSHGMRQKLIICGALVHRPEVIVVDEPMVGLDPKSARLLKDLFRQFVDRGGTVLMSTHTLEVAEVDVRPDRDRATRDGSPRSGTMAELRQQTESGDDEPGGSLPQAHRRPRASTSSTPCSSAERGGRRAAAAGHLDAAHPQVAGRARAPPAGAARDRGPSCCCSRSPAGCSGPRSSASPSGCSATSSRSRTSATCSPARCSASSCSRFLSILLLSNIITALSTFFLAKDLDLLVAAPVGWLRLYLAKLSETVVHSSWMVALLALPIFTAYGIVYSGGPLFPLRRAGGVRAVPGAPGGGRRRSSPCCW